MKMLTAALVLSASTLLAQTNPFFTESTLPFHAPPFDKIHDADYQPAIEEGMKQHLAEIEAIENDPALPTFANTIEAMEKSGRLLGRVQRVFSGMSQANTNPTIQKVQSEEAQKLAAHRDAIYLNPKLFARVKAVYETRASLNPEQKHLVERTYKDFVRSGALLSDAEKEKLRALNKEQSKLTTDFRKRVLADTNASALVIDDVKELDGLPQADIDAAAEAAKSRNLAGKWVLALQNTTQQPQQTYLKNRAVRERLFRASSLRGNHGGENDTTAIVTRLAQLRAERAKLLGYPSFAAYELEENMAKGPHNAIKLMTDMVPATVEKTHGEAARMQKLAPEPLQPWDWQFYAEELRKKEYDLDEAQVRPYFEIDRVLRDGVFYAATKLYGITFKKRHDLPVYQADVRVFDVIDADGKPLAIFYFDPFARSNKAGGAWTSTFVGQSKLLGTKTVNYNVENFPKPAPGQPALLTFGEVTTMFHEFGHALHGMFSNVTYPTSGGTPRDWVEFPSQFNEHWALEPSVFANYARHYKTGDPMPKELVAKLQKSRTFNQGYATAEYLEAALLDQAWHALPAAAPQQQDVDAFEQATLMAFRIHVAEVPPRYRTTYFSHIWAGGYEAGYYAYIWSEVLARDTGQWFTSHGGLTRENGNRFRDLVLSRGRTKEPRVLFERFYGGPPQIGPLLEYRGLMAGHEHHHAQN